MHNLKIFFIVSFFITILVLGLEWLPSLVNKPVFFEAQNSYIDDKKSDKTSDILLQEACLKCHSMKYNDIFVYKPEIYEKVHKEFNNAPMDISLLSKIYTKDELTYILQKEHTPELEISSSTLKVVVEYLFIDKNKARDDRIGYFVVGFFLLLSLLIYIKIILQRSEKRKVTF